MSRSLKKGPYQDERLLKKVKFASKDSKQILKTWNRSATIVPDMVGFTFGVYNGRTHIPVLVNEDMVGHKLGEFSPTRKFIKHGGRMAREEEQEARTKEQVQVKSAGDAKEPESKSKEESK